MKIIKPYAKMMVPPCCLDQDEEKPEEFSLEMGIELLKHVEWCARISHRSEDAVAEDSWRRIIQSVVLDHGDWSVVEHASVSVDAYVDRGITHEWVRHRLFSYTQESTRFVNYEKKIPPAFIYPDPKVECPRCLGGDTEIQDTFIDRENDIVVARHKGGEECKYNWTWRQCIEQVELGYKALLEKGWRPQEARSVFPNALASRLITTGNLRNWRHFFIMRTSKEAHPQMKQVTIPLLKEFQEKIPLLFDDIVPEEKQSIAMKRVR